MRGYAEILIAELSKIRVSGHMKQLVLCVMRRIGPCSSGQILKEIPHVDFLSALQLSQLKKKGLIVSYYDSANSQWPTYHLSRKVKEAFDKAEHQFHEQ